MRNDQTQFKLEITFISGSNNPHIVKKFKFNFFFIKVIMYNRKIYEIEINVFMYIINGL